MAKKKGILKNALSQIGKTEKIEQAKEKAAAAKERIEQLDDPKYKKHNAINNDPNKLTADGRKRFNTMLDPNLKKRLRNYADDNGMSIADLIEQISKTFLKSKGY